MLLPEIVVSVKIKNKSAERHTINCSQHAYNYAMQIFNADTIEWTEEFIMLCLNRRNRLVSYYKVASGGTAGVLVDPKIIFTIALNSGAHSIIVAHNHPSGELDPSDEDKRITQKIKAGGEVLDVKLLDHLICTPNGFFSFADEGLIFN